MNLRRILFLLVLAALGAIQSTVTLAQEANREAVLVGKLRVHNDKERRALRRAVVGANFDHQNSNRAFHARGWNTRDPNEVARRTRLTRMKLRHKGTIDQDGNFRVQGIPAGVSGWVFVTVPGYRGLSLKIPPLAAGTKHEYRTRSLIEGRVLEGRVTDAEGEPLSGAAVFALSQSRNWWRDMRVPASPSGKNGHFRISGLDAAEYELFVTKEGCESTWRRVSLVDGNLQEVDIVVSPEGTFHGKVIDERGNPLPKAQVTLSIDSESQQVTTTDKGVFSFEGLPPQGKFVLLVAFEDFPTQEFHADSVGALPWRIALRSDAVLEIVLRNYHEPTKFYYTFTGASQKHGVVDYDGERLVFEDLPTGYVLLTLVGPRHRAELQAKLVAGKTARGRDRVSKLRERNCVVFEVVDESGAPVPYAIVQLKSPIDTYDEAFERGLTGPDGRFYTESEMRVDEVVTAEADGFLSTRKVFEKMVFKPKVVRLTLRKE